MNKGKEGVSSDLINIPATASGISEGNANLPQFTPAEEKFNFGKIIQGDKKSHSFSCL